MQKGLNYIRQREMRLILYHGPGEIDWCSDFRAFLYYIVI